MPVVRHKRPAKRRQNPYFRQGRKRGETRTLIIRVLVSLLVLVVLWFVFHGPWMQLEGVEVEGASEDITLDIEAAAADYLDNRFLLVWKRSNRLFLNSERLIRKLEETQPINSATVSIHKGALHISVSEKIRTFYLLKEDVMYSMDRFGMVLGALDDVERMRIEVRAQTERVPLIYDRRSSVVGEGENVLPPAWLEDIVTLFDQVQGRTMLTPLTAEISDEEGRVDVNTDAGVVLYTSMERPIDEQVDKLASLIDKKLVDITELSYIDLRFKNRLFYH